MTVVWEDPPPVIRGEGGRPRIWWPLLEPLTERSGEWARVSEGPLPRLSNVATALRGTPNGLAIPPGRWESAIRRINGDTYGLWARWLGPEEV